jgi:hypothetical protein
MRTFLLALIATATLSTQAMAVVAALVFLLPAFTARANRRSAIASQGIILKSKES